MRYYAINHREWNQGWQGLMDTPALYGVDEDNRPLFYEDRKFYAGPGPTYCRISDKSEPVVVGDYGTDWEAAQVKFAEDYPPEKFTIAQKPPRCPGWIAPNGDFYPCPSWGHDSLQAHISLIKWGDTKHDLTKHGWMRLYTDMVTRPRNITERQRTALAAIIDGDVIKPGFPEYQLKDAGIRDMKRAIHSEVGQ